MGSFLCEEQDVGFEAGVLGGAFKARFSGWFGLEAEGLTILRILQATFAARTSLMIGNKTAAKHRKHKEVDVTFLPLILTATTKKVTGVRTAT